jgi:serine protease Do
MQTSTFKRSAIAAAVVGAFAVGAVTAERMATIKPAVGAPAPAAVMATSTAASSAALPDFADLVARNGASVVQISVAHDVRKPAARRGRGAPEGDELPPWFRNFPFPMPPSEGPSQGSGSGFVVATDGVILTNAHVVADATEVTVRLTDQREFKAKVLGSDRTTDVAVLKIDASGLPVVKVGDPAATRVGEWVVAIGAPYGLDNTVTSGIVSAKSRALPGDAAVPFIQTDAAVNPGNSGGPLFNLKGEVIGINSQIFSRSGGFQGVAFAIPIDVAMNVKEQIQQHGKVQHGRLGVAVRPLSPGDRKSGDLANGVVVEEVAGAAAKAGVRPGDVIMSVNSTPVKSPEHLKELIGKAGKTVALLVKREDAKIFIPVTLG